MQADDGDQPSTFAGVARDPAWWLFRAQDLSQAATVLFEAFIADRQRFIDLNEPGLGVDKKEVPNLSIAPVAMLLFGLAVENVLKAMIVKNDPTIVGDEKLGRWGARDHDLVKLAERAGLQLEPADRDLLARLGLFLLWRGRYPVPNRAPDSAQPFANSAGQDDAQIRLDDAENVKSFLVKVQRHAGFPLPA